MSDDWDTYFCTVADKPASILANLGLGRHAPFPALPYMAYVGVNLLKPDTNGLDTPGESARLAELEKALVPALEENGLSVFVGRCTTDGQRDFIFYVANPEGWAEKAETVMRLFSEYAWETSAHKDAAWETYLELLYPDERSMNAIRNNRARRQLQERGDDGSAPRPVDHRLYFSTEKDRAAFAAEAESEGFAARPEEKPGEGGSFGLRLVREDAPGALDEVTWNLGELAGANGGWYDGWTCPAAKAESSKPSCANGALPRPTQGA